MMILKYLILKINDKILSIIYYSTKYFIFIACPANPIQKKIKRNIQNFQLKDLLFFISISHKL